jgi:glycosyltransferase involved in cell wall biosynthesis
LFCDAIVTINKEDFLNAQKMFCKNVYRINGVGVDTAKYSNVTIDRSHYRKNIGVEDNQIMVLSVGELSARKNHVVIIDALADLANKEKYVYVICGNGINGGTGDLLKQRAEDRNVNLRLLGFRFDIPQMIHCSDIGAIPSVREGLGLAGIQSLAGGCL